MKDIETLLLERLSATDVEVYTEVPKDKPERFISLERTGGPFEDMILDKPIVVILCWAESRLEAKNLALKVDSLVRSMADDIDDVVESSRQSLFNSPDPTSHKPRYQIVANFQIQY